MKNKKELLKRLGKIRLELGDIANAFSGDKDGISASLLHLSSSLVYDALNAIEADQPPNQRKVSYRVFEWESNVNMINFLDAI